MSVLGIDIAKAKFNAYLLETPEAKGRSRSFTNTESGFAALLAWLEKYGSDQPHVCMEASGPYGTPLAEFLHACGYAVSVVNPARIRRYADSKLVRNKTDAADATVIALFCLNEKPRVWTPLKPEVKELRALIRRAEDLRAMRVQELNRRDKTHGPNVRDTITRMVEFIEEQLRELDALMREHIAAHPALEEQVRLLVSIPGVSAITARKLVAEIDFASFKDARAVAAYAGLTPRQHQSGSSVWQRPRISRMGSSSLRHALFMPGLVASKLNPVTKAFASNLLARGKSKKSVICAVMRKLLHIAYGILKSGIPFDPQRIPLSAN